MKLVPGLYETLVTRAMNDALDASADLVPVTEGTAPHLLARFVQDALVRAFRGLPAEDRLEKQLSLANAVVELLATRAADSGVSDDEQVLDPARMLLAIRRAADARLGTGEIPRPTLPLRHSDLIVNGPRDLRLGHELRREIDSADGVDVIVSFLKSTGLRLVKDQLNDLAARSPSRLRVLTTTYLGATDAKAIEDLLDLGAQVKVSYDERRTRLHAKAWLFHRDSGFSTALVGSSNLSHAAMLDGCEWNVRLSGVDNRPVLDKFVATFEQYWGDPRYEPYDVGRFREAGHRRDPQRDALARAMQLRPYPHQQAVLDALAVERGHGHHKNLVVAATGTGKTVVAALDYARLQKAWGHATLLFVAHREEILSQSLATYRQALRDGHFGEMLVGTHKAVSGRHVFASIQSLHEGRLAALARDAYDVVVVDEFHHAAADSYDALLRHLQPKVLLGLTATPERSDGRSVLGWFDGRIASEIRLWDALDMGLVSPFHYFGIHDDTDLSTVAFKDGRYDTATLERLYTADHVRANAVLRAIFEKVGDPRSMRALGFCVSVRHAEFMAKFFTAKGIPSVAVMADTPEEARRDALHRLRLGEINVVFARDLLNEGIDVPAVDTVLFLRPTESAGLFLQQLGRGLRLEDGKACLTVLDFIGNANRRFRFLDRFRALVPGTRAAVKDAIEEGFPFLPAGCDIRLDAQATRAVLANVREALTSNWRAMAEDLRHVGDVSLPAFLEEADLELEDLYARTNRSFLALRHEAGLRAGPAPNTALSRSVARLLHVDDDARLERWRTWLRAERPPPADAADPLMLMFFVALGQRGRPVAEMAMALGELWAMSDLRAELVDLLDLLADRARRPTTPLPGLPFHVHGTYSRDEISAGLGQVRGGTVMRTQGGVLCCPDARADVLYVEVDKDPRHYTPTTLYNDHAISPTRFHWESQGVTRASSETGRRYATHAAQGWRILLFVRKAKEDARRFTSPYMCLGPVNYVSHESEKPMRIVWELENAMPPEFFARIKIAAG